MIIDKSLDYNMLVRRRMAFAAVWDLICVSGAEVRERAPWGGGGRNLQRNMSAGRACEEGRLAE